ncbi:MAG TPA: nuclease-related domain-containing protein [Steroidobacteraceae bacterium]|nr:nuclease-related domain-containing protein [Steroidobacteraceae bacterium]HRX88587.1 nuclease-related domain-containing protein [Steroidobacteraceae bacterium]
MNAASDNQILELAIVALAAVLVGIVAWFVVRAVRERQIRRQKVDLLTGGAVDFLENVLVPDGSGGSYHVDFLLLNARGVIVIDWRDLRGNVFGGDQMTEWTVMNGGERFTFPNPLNPLYDRIAAVKLIVKDVPVEGRIVFSRRAQFPKGLPKWTVKLDAMLSEFPPLERSAVETATERYLEAWGALKQAAQPSSLHKARAVA